ncbi:MAG: hypothetical protein PHI68_03180 [Candidatus Cloacimonetes bacterium]|nr:hypothetical protein [Candidatus Cloacimonadota bacterium]
MQKKRLTLLVAVVLLAAVMSFAGCGKSGSKFANSAPTIKITSYEGVDTMNQFVLDDDGNQILDDQGNPIPNPFYQSLADLETSTPILFQQSIYWHATDTDGSIEGYAFRLLDESGNPISTPGNRFLDGTGAVTPDNVANKFGVGWILHYNLGANQNIPLDSPDANRTIWSSKKYVTINFPGADANGNPSPRISRFEVIAKDNRGDITQQAAFRVFKTSSAKPTCTVTTTKGNPDGGQVGTGIRLSFSLQDPDPFLQATAWYYEFKVRKFTYPGNQMISTTDWISTSSQPKINQYLLTKYTTPSLSSDYDSAGQQVTYTEVLGRVFDLAGIVSDTLVYNEQGQLIGKSTITFAVKEGFHPRTDIYPQKFYSLGDYHFIDYNDESTPEILPFTIIGGVQRFATPLFKNFENEYTAVHSSNIKVWVRWGWWGEYARVTTGGQEIPVTDPYERKVDKVLDATTNRNYYSEITHFDIRFNGEPYNFVGGYIVTDNDNKRWRRVPTNSPLGQTVVLTNPLIYPGTHTFEVRCVDLQDEVDPNPAVIQFKLESYIPPASRSGILIIDDDQNNATYAPDDVVQEKYEYMLSGYNGTKTFKIRNAESNPGNTFADVRGRNLSLSDLQHYKMVIHHSDHPSNSSTLPRDHDGITMYIQNGGNLLLSGTHLVSSMLDAVVTASQRTLISNLGINYALGSASSVLGSATGIQINPFMQKAVGQAGFSDLYTQYFDEDDPTNYPEATFNSVVNARKGIGIVTYFNNYTAEPIYRLGCKPTSYYSYPPTQAQYDLFNNKVIGLRQVNPNNRCYLLGFPLTYMHKNNAKLMMDKILGEVM